MKEVRVGPHAVSGGLQSRGRSPEGGGILLPDSRPPRQLLPGSPGCPPALQILTHQPPALREPIPENRSLCLLLSLCFSGDPELRQHPEPEELYLVGNCLIQKGPHRFAWHLEEGRRGASELSALTFQVSLWFACPEFGC